MKFVLYSSEGCTYCAKIKKDLTDWGYEYEERNVTDNPDYFNDLHEQGMFSTPVLFVDDKPFIGYRPKKLKKYLGIDKQEGEAKILKEDVVVIGTGSAGYTSAIYLSRANLNPLVIDGPEAGGQLTLTTDVENFPGFASGITGPKLMDEMREQATRFGTRFMNGWVTKIDTDQTPYVIHMDDGTTIETTAVVVATGASAKRLGIEGEDENFGRGVSVCATCDGSFFTDQRVIVVGGGDSAMEEANFLTKFAKEVTVVHRREEFRASKVMLDRAKNNPNITIKTSVKPVKVNSDNGKVTSLTVEHAETGEKENIETDGVFVAIGHNPNTGFLPEGIETDEKGYIVTKPRNSETSIEGIFAAGDVQDPVYQQAITAAGSGCMAAMDAEVYLASKE